MAKILNFSTFGQVVEEEIFFWKLKNINDNVYTVIEDHMYSDFIWPNLPDFSLSLQYIVSL